MELYTEGDLVTRTVRDVFTSDVDGLVVDNKEVAKRVKEVIKLSNPRTRNKVELYEEPMPLFHQYGIEREIELMYSRHVPLPSGGSLVIDSTEAIVAIDVNSGKIRDHSDAETTAFKTDMEAADEICRQLKLRDLGGVIICDFIDLRYERHRRDLEHRLHDNLKNDRAKTKVLRDEPVRHHRDDPPADAAVDSSGRSISTARTARAPGLVKTPESMSLDVMRRLAIAINDKRVERIELSVCPEVASIFRTRSAPAWRSSGGDRKTIVIRNEGRWDWTRCGLTCSTIAKGWSTSKSWGCSRSRRTPRNWARGRRTGIRPRGRGGRDDRQRRPGPPPRHPQPREDELPEERFERVDQEAEDREHDEQDELRPSPRPLR